MTSYERLLYLEADKASYIVAMNVEECYIATVNTDGNGKVAVFIKSSSGYKTEIFTISEFNENFEIIASFYSEEYFELICPDL